MRSITFYYCNYRPLKGLLYITVTIPMHVNVIFNYISNNDIAHHIILFARLGSLEDSGVDDMNNLF